MWIEGGEDFAMGVAGFRLAGAKRSIGLLRHASDRFTFGTAFLERCMLLSRHLCS